MNDVYILRMTDKIGMFQHAVGDVPDPAEGYTSDDNARALIMAILLYEATENRKYLDLAYIYLHFLVRARNGTWFRNFTDPAGNFIEERGSEDCFGRCIWSLGFTAVRDSLPADLRQTAEDLLQKTIAGSRELRYLRAKAYTVLGLCRWNQKGASMLLSKLASDLADAYSRNTDAGWHWFEDNMTYCNAVLPWAMLEAYDRTETAHFFTIGRESLDFLCANTFRKDMFCPVGCKGWLQKGKPGAVYDQQPVEAYITMLACLKLHALTKEEKYRAYARSCFEWYIGKNLRGMSLIGKKTGGCKNGVLLTGLNPNQGAESLIAWTIASVVWQKNQASVSQRRALYDNTI